MNTLDKVYDLTIDIKNIDVKYNSYAKFFDDDRETSVIRIKLLNDKTPMNLENCIVEAYFILADNTYHNEACKIINSSEGVVELQLCQKCLVKGENIVRLSILKDNEISNTPVITYEVRKGLYSDNPNFNDDPLTPILSQMLLDIKVTKVNQIELQERYEKSLPKIEGKIKEVESLINRVNNAIASGTQDLEVKDARVGKNGKSYAKLGDRLNEVDSQLEHIEKQSSEYRVYVENFEGETVNEKIENAITYAKNNRLKEVYLASKDYILNDTLVIPTGIKLIGCGWERDDISGTRILRNGNFTAIMCLPYEKNETIYHSQGIEFHNICFIDYNSNNVEDFMYCEKNSMMVFSNCWFRGMYSNQIVLAEVMDSRFYNCAFEESRGETSVKLISNIESLVTGYMLEYTNQIMFTDCRWESYLNSAVINEGQNTNEIYFNNCKMESFFSNTQHLSLNSCAVINFNGLQICSGTTETVDCIVLLKECYGVFGTIIAEHSGSSAEIDSFVKLDNPNNNDIYVYLYEGASKITGNVVNVVNNWAKNSFVNGSIKGSQKDVCNLPFKYNTILTNQVNFIGGGSNSSYYLKTYNQGDNSVVKVIRNTSDGDSVIFEFNEKGELVTNGKLFITNALGLPYLSESPWADNSHPTLFVDSNTNTLKVYLNGAYRTIQTV